MGDEVTLRRMPQVGHHRAQAVQASAETQVMMVQDLRVADRIADLCDPAMSQSVSANLQHGIGDVQNTVK